MKLSIIIPAYNVEKYLPATLDSLLSIRFSHDYEIIVVNDGSADSTGDVVRDYQQKSNNIRLFSVENQGVSNARNLGLRQATGEYITFVDGDDTVEPDFYEKAVTELDRGGYDFVQGCYREVHPDKTLYPMRVEQDTVLDDRREILEAFCCPGKKRIHNAVWSKVFRSDIARRISFDTELTIGEDTKYVFDILCMTSHIKLLTEQCVNYFQRTSSAVHTMDGKKMLEDLKVMIYCKEKMPYPELAHQLELYQAPILLKMYYELTVEKNAGAVLVRKELKRFPYWKLRSQMDKKTRRRILMHKYAGSIYDLFLAHKVDTDRKTG